MSAAFNHIPPAGCPANLDTLRTHQAGNDSRAIPAPATVGSHHVRLRRRRRMIPERRVSAGSTSVFEPPQLWVTSYCAPSFPWRCSDECAIDAPSTGLDWR